MSVNYPPEHLDRFLYTMGIVSKEAKQLERTRAKIFGAVTVDAGWVERLENDEYWPDVLESFVSKFGRMQDTVVDKLLPRFLLLVGEKPGSAIDNLNRAEQLGLMRSSSEWLAMRGLRNKMVHEYMENPVDFAESLNLANRFTNDLLQAYHNIQHYARATLHIDYSLL